MNILERFLPKSKKVRMLCLLVYDICAVQLCSILALWVRFDMMFLQIPPEYLKKLKVHTAVFTMVVVLVFCIFRMYSNMWGSAGVLELYSIALACMTSAGFQWFSMEFFKLQMPRSYYVLWFFFMILLTGASRMSYRLLSALNSRIYQKQNKKEKTRVMLIGAGDAGAIIIKELLNSRYANGTPICIIDDDANKVGRYIYGVQVKGTRQDIVRIAEKEKIDEIYVAMPSAPPAEIRAILEICQQTKCQLKRLPGVYQMMNGDVSVAKMRKVELEDLLGRVPISINLDEIMSYVKDQVVLVTGGGGSIGSELCRQLAGHGVKQLIIFDMYENNAYEIQQELKRSHPELNLEVLIGSVRNTGRMKAIFSTYHPDIVYHAAAHKHVPLMEDSPNEAIKNNVIGTYKTAMAAIQNGTKRFILISTDKAVNPTNIMGASKRLCEMVIQMCDRKSDTEFVAVRFGNVLGSNGSVVPLFKKQIEKGGPVTVTHPDIIRYFMTIPEAVSLVIQTGAYAKDGEIFVLNMGEPVRILDMAEKLIRLSGYEPYTEMPIEFTGLRPGEKLYEELLMNEEGLKETKNSRIFIGTPIEIDYGRFEEKLRELDDAAWRENADIRKLVGELVPEYRYQEV